MVVVARLIVFEVYFGNVFGVVVVQMKIVDSRRICILVVHLQIKV